MTNGEMIRTIFPNEKMYEQTPTMTYYGMMRVDTEWWNTEYKEPIKALEQEPFINKSCVSEKVCEQDKQMVLDKIKAEIKEWYWQADKQKLAEDPCVVDAMVDLFIRTIDKYKAKSEE